MIFFTLKKQFVIAFSFMSTVVLYSQSSIYLENFDASATTLPMGWTTTSSGWEVSASNPSTAFPGGSGVNSVKIDNNNVATGTYSLVTKSIATTGYSGITVSWLARLTTNFPPSTIDPYLYYSTNNGSTWSSVAYTEASSASTWSLNTVSLPSTLNNKPSVMFQLVASAISASNGAYRIDDFQVKGTPSTSVEEFLNIIDVTIYAFNKVLYFQANDNEKSSQFDLTIYSLDGKEMMVKKMSRLSEQMDLSHFTTGMYFIKITSSGHQALIKKIIID